MAAQRLGSHQRDGLIRREIAAVIREDNQVECGDPPVSRVAGG